MTTDHPSNTPSPQLSSRAVLFSLSLSFGLLVSAAVSIPFFYPTQTLWYKSGIDKFVLQLGQAAGLLGVLFLCGQIFLALRPRFLERIVGIAKIMSMHRANALIIIFFICAHALMILAPEGLTNLPVGKKYWPEMLGGFILLTLWLTVVLSFFREQLQIPYLQWRIVHKPAGYAILVLIVIHIFYVNEIFHRKVPAIAICLLLTALGSYIFYRKLFRENSMK